jgi:hypothetical protein
MIKKWFAVIIYSVPYLLISSLLTPLPAHAYVDLSTGSLVTQGLISCILWLSFSLKFIVQKVRKSIRLDRN